MSIILGVTLAGMVLIAACGFLGRRSPTGTLEEWTVGGRQFGVFATWFLQAGESFTTFSFLAVAGVAFSGGVAATYAIPYLPIAYALSFFIGPRLWRLGRDRGYITQADYFADRYRSPGLGKLVAAVGVIFLLPYLQLQITGLGLVVQLVTGSKSSGTISMIVATVLSVAFVLWAGIQGLAGTAYLKDFLMLFAMVVLIVAIPLHYTGGIGRLFEQVSATRPAALLVPAHGQYNSTWWLTGMLISAIGVGFMTNPALWPATLAARSAKVVRRNYAFLPMYQIVIILPVIIGFVGLVALPEHTSSNGVLLTLAHGALPAWLTGVIAVGAAAAAMVPAAGMCLAISSLVANNLVPLRTDRARLRLNHAVVVIAASGALVLGITRPDLLANLLLLTWSGLAQLAPGFTLGLARRVRCGTASIASGIVVGVAVVAIGTFGHLKLGGVNVGLIGLAANIAVIGLVEAVRRMRPVADRPAPEPAAAAPNPIGVRAR